MSQRPPHLSPDGNWYWDGQRWVPMPRPTGAPVRKTGTTVVVVAVLAALFLSLVGIGLFVATQRLASQTIFQKTVAVTVTDDNGNALSGATVVVQGSSASATTESTGVANLGLGSLTPGIYTLVAIDRPGYVNTGTQFSIPDSGNPAPVAIRMPWAPPLGTFVWHWKSTVWSVMVISGGDPDFTLQGYDIEWHCYGTNWSQYDVTVSLGQDHLTFGGTNVPIGPGTMSTAGYSVALSRIQLSRLQQAPASTVRTPGNEIRRDRGLPAPVGPEKLNDYGELGRDLSDPAGVVRL